MSTITGKQLSDLSTLTLGATTTRFYAVSSSNNSYQITEENLYNTLNKLHISGAYQPKNEDWRFIHKTGTESITGFKTFVNNTTFSDSIIGDSISDSSSDVSINTLNRYLYDGSANYSIKWADRYLLDSTETLAIDWNNRILSGNWTAESLSSSSSNYVSGNKVSLTINMETGRVTGLGLASIPRSVTLTVEKPVDGLLLFAALSGAPTTDGFKYQLNSATDLTSYKLHYNIVL